MKQFLNRIPIEESWDDIQAAAELLGLDVVSIRRWKPTAKGQMDLQKPYTHWEVVLQPKDGVQEVAGF